jgi:hypothetical protein
MNIKEFMQEVKANFIAISERNRHDENENYWTKGLCISLVRVNAILRDSGQYAKGRQLLIAADKLIYAHRPENPCVFWWPNRKDSCSFEEAFNPRLEVLDKIINSL